MSCTVMYQPYAMSYSSSSASSASSSSCEKSSDKKLFKLPQAPSPSDSLHSEGSSYNSPGPSGQSSNHSQSRRPLTPVISHSGSQHNLLASSSRSSTCTTAPLLLGEHQDGGGGGTSASSSPRNNHSHHSHSLSSRQHQSGQGHSSSQGHTSSHGSSSSLARAGSSGNQVQYLSANAAIYINYNGDASRIVDEHFTRALSAAYSSDKISSKCPPMSTRSFPPSFWNSNYQPNKPLANYSAAAASAAEFYGAAVDYGGSLSSLGHHHQPDPWHYPLPPPHQTYHHRPTEIPYPSIPSSRFNASQYGSFLLAGAAASSGAGRFGGMSTSAQCGVVNVKGVGDGSSWPGGRYHHHHHHDSHALSDLHNLADYSAAAAAHYSNMAAGLESTVVQDSTKDLYWF